MTRMLSLILALALLITLGACGGGGGGNGATSGSGLSPLDFDVTTDPTSTVGADDVIGYAVNLTNPMYAEIEAAVPAGYKLAAVLQFGPDTPQGAGFSGDFTVRTTNRAASTLNYTKVIIKYETKKDRDGRLILVRDGVGAGTEGSSASFRFRLDYLGVVVLLEPTGSQFEAAAFADLSTTTYDVPINFWAISRGGDAPLTYSWTFGDGSTALGAEVTHTYPTVGVYNVTVVATDSAGNETPVASTPITILGNPVPLSAVTVVVTPIDGETFEYSATLNGGTPPFEYEWDFDSNGTVDSTEGPHTINVVPAAGVYIFELHCTDQLGSTASTTGVVDARKLILSGGTLTGYAPHTTNFAVTTEGTSPLDAVTIDFGDGSTGDPGTHTFDNPSVYVVLATVTRIVNGIELKKDSNELIVTVDPRPDPRIDSVVPARARVGEDVTLFGEFFFTQEQDNVVLMETMEMVVKSWTPTEIVVTIPAGAKDWMPVVIDKPFPQPERESGPVFIDIAPSTPDQPDLGQL
ncbi:MAG: PKD domain-containing protein [bacterium]|nr:PKD domain-containing protein [bacterium]